MPAEQFWRREIHQAALVLVDQPPAFDADMPLLPGRMQRRAHTAGLRLDDRHRFRRLLGADHRHVALDDGGLLGGNRAQRVTEKLHMVHADRRDDGRDRPVDDVGGVEPAAESGLQQHDIGFMPRKQTECRRGLDLENRDRLARIDVLAMLQHPAQLGVINQPAAAALADAEAFVDPHQIGRGVDVDAQARGFEDRAQIGDSRTLAVGARDMDHRRQQALRDDRAAPAAGACDRG